MIMQVKSGMKISLQGKGAYFLSVSQLTEISARLKCNYLFRGCFYLITTSEISSPLISVKSISL